MDQQRGYVSEFSQFMNAYLQAHPAALEDQMQGWYRLWDRPVDLKEQAKAENDSVPAPKYGYE